MTSCPTFSADYAEAREKFLAAARIAGAEMHRYDNPTKGLQDEALSCDAAWLGPADASRVIVAISGTHGVEGFCGSGVQVDWLMRLGATALPEGSAALMVHAINPYGFSWVRRVTEEGCDLNRNYLEFKGKLPENPGYDELADAIVPKALTGRAIEEADARLVAYRKEHGDVAYHRALSGGQYRHPQGMFYGGTEPTWAHRTARSIAETLLKGRADVGVIDFHTGLGPFGYGELITHYAPDTSGSARVRDWWGQSVTESKRGQTQSQARDGLGHYGFNRWLKGTRVTMATLEYGTYDREQGFAAFRGDHWLHLHGDPKGKEAGPIRAAIRRQFYPDTDDWKEMILFRGHQAIRQAIAGLQRGGGN
jgi:hypothetical protein